VIGKLHRWDSRSVIATASKPDSADLPDRGIANRLRPVRAKSAQAAEPGLRLG